MKRIILSGVETVNKGAELMLYAILQEIERKFPDATVYIARERLKQGIKYLDTKVKVKYWPFDYLVETLKLRQIFSILHLPLRHLQDVFAVKKADYFLDGSGLFFSDKWNFKKERVDQLKKILRRQYNEGCKIIFLPQAFGPLEKDVTRQMIEVLNEYATVIMPRDTTSFNYLDASGLVDMKKVKKYTDFTSLVEGQFPVGYEHLKGAVCVIPNVMMINSKTINIDDYTKLMVSIVSEVRKKGRPVYILNHEGYNDEGLAYRLKESIGGDIEVVTRLNALHVKGLIGSAYLLITSRYHGLASALNSAIPCLSTSWSHKYQELYNDFQMEDCLLPLDNVEMALKKVDSFLDETNNSEIRKHLKCQKEHIQQETRRMWDMIWEFQE